MSTSIEKILPPKLNLEIVANELDLLKYSSDTQLGIILHHQRDNGLALKSSAHFESNAQEASHGLDEELDVNGNAILFSRGDTTWITTHGKPLTLGPAHLTAKSQIATFSFAFEGKEYYSLDDPGRHPISLYYNIRDIYVDKSDLEIFLKDGVEKIPPYADPASGYYAPELALAIRLHKALQVEKEGNPYLNLNARISRWLTKNVAGGAVSDGQISRLRAIIGPGKKIQATQKK